MIKWSVKKKHPFFLLELTGHAEYDIAGKDIVCSAVSSIVLNTCNILRRLGHLKSCTHQNGLLTAIIDLDSHVSNEVCDVLIEELKDLESQYPNNIKRVDYVDTRNIINE